MPNPTGKNGKLPPPELVDLAPTIKDYWKMGMSDKRTLELLNRFHVDHSKHYLSLRTFRNMRRTLGLESSRSSQHTAESLRPIILRLRGPYAESGERDMRMHLRAEGIWVTRSTWKKYTQVYEVNETQARKAKNLRRKRWWSAGVGDIWCIDQHDKWGPRFDLWLHVGLEPFSGRILWTKIWRNNRDPALITSYYLESVERHGVMPLVTQSDLGSENYGVAKAQTALRHYHDPSLIGTIQHRWEREKKNIKPEILWSQLRKRWVPGFERMLEQGVVLGWYDANNPIHRFVFWWVFVPYLQKELDNWVDQYNNNPKRKDKHKLTPHGPPNLIFTHPDFYGEMDFHVRVHPEGLQAIQSLYASPDLDIFRLVPLDVATLLEQEYLNLNEPLIEFSTAWDVYRCLLQGVLDRLRASPNPTPSSTWETWTGSPPPLDTIWTTPPQGMELRDGHHLQGVSKDDYSRYMGGVHGGLGDVLGGAGNLEDDDEEDSISSSDGVLYVDFASDEALGSANKE